MNRLTLGQTGISVPDWCLGTMTFGTQTEEPDAFAQMDLALEAGLDFFDTAEMYPVNPVRKETVGECERLIGRWLAQSGKRDKVILATKAGGDSPMIRGGEGYGPANIERLIDANLARLGTDYIDLYQLHWPMRGSYMFRQNWTYDPSAQEGGNAGSYGRGAGGAGPGAEGGQDPRLWHVQRKRLGLRPLD